MEFHDRAGDLISRLMLKFPRWMVFGIYRGLEQILDRSDRSSDYRIKRRIQMLDNPPRKKGLIQRWLASSLKMAGDWPPLERMSKQVASWACEKFDRWARRAELARFCPEANLLRQLRRIIDGTARAHDQAMLRLLSRPRPPRIRPDPAELLWNEKFLEVCMRSMLLKLPKEPGPPRKVINWRFWDADLSASEINFMSMMQRIHLAIGPKGWQFLTFRNYGDFELGSLTKSVGRSEFFQFQNQFNTILEVVDLKFSGSLALTWSDSESKRDPHDPYEQYKADRLTFGDGNGRPRRHETPVLPVLPVKDVRLST